MVSRGYQIIQCNIINELITGMGLGLREVSYLGDGGKLLEEKMDTCPALDYKQTSQRNLFLIALHCSLFYLPHAITSF